MKFVKRILREFFMLDASKQFKWTIFVIVLIAAILGVATREAKAGDDFEAVLASHATSPPIIQTSPKPIKEENDLYTEESHPNEYCIALNIYYESRADNLAGKYAVADVVLNRVADPRFEDTVCKVIREAVMYESWKTAQHKDLPDEERIYYPKRNMCQFSWYCDGKPDDPLQQAAWRDAQIIAYNIVQFNTFRGITEGATHYHATYVAPDWSLEEWRPVYHLIGRIGDHIFYKWSYKNTSLSKNQTKFVVCVKVT